MIEREYERSDLGGSKREKQFISCLLQWDQIWPPTQVRDPEEEKRP